MEGPKSLAAAYEQGRQAATLMGGSSGKTDLMGLWLKHDIDANQRFILCPDNDKAGHGLMDRIAEVLKESGFKYSRISMDGEKESADIADFDKNWLDAKLEGKKMAGDVISLSSVKKGLFLPNSGKTLSVSQTEQAYDYDTEEKSDETPFFLKPVDLFKVFEKTDEDRMFWKKGSITLIAGPSGAGKSSLAALMTLQAISGKAVLFEDDEGFEPENVAVVWGEEGEDPFIQKMQASIGLHAMSAKDLGSRLKILSDNENGESFQLVGDSADKSKDFLAEILIRSEIDLLIIDSFSVVAQDAEEKNTLTNAVMNKLQHIAKKADVAVVLLHHTRKPPTGESVEISLNSIRGASSMAQLPRFAFMVEEEVDKKHRVTCVKDNYGGKKGDEYFYDHEQVQIHENGAMHHAIRMGDAPAFSGVQFNEEHQLSAIQQLLEMGDDSIMRSDPKSKRWAGYALADILQMAQPARQTLRNILAKAVEKGWLEKGESKDGKNKMRPTYLKGKNLPPKTEEEKNVADKM